MFSEGLAAARTNGCYGYINAKGQFVIKPIYDYATTFKNGQALVYVNGKSFYINKKGKSIFKSKYQDVVYEGNNKYLVLTKSLKRGVVNEKGKLIIDTLYDKLGNFNEGLALAQENGELGVIDIAGNEVVYFGLYANIGPFKNGYAEVVLKEKDKYHRSIAGIIDTTGDFHFKEKRELWCFGSNSVNDNIFCDGLCCVSIFSNQPDTLKYHSAKDTYAGCIDINGNVQFSNANWTNITPFSHNHAFARRTDNKWILIDRQGNQVGNDADENILYSSYFNDKG